MIFFSPSLSDLQRAREELIYERTHTISGGIVSDDYIEHPSIEDIYEKALTYAPPIKKQTP